MDNVILVRMLHFLSCLFGSEPGGRPGDRRGPFLSCLFGSEQDNVIHVTF